MNDRSVKHLGPPGLPAHMVPDVERKLRQVTREQFVLVTLGVGARVEVAELSDLKTHIPSEPNLRESIDSAWSEAGTVPRYTGIVVMLAPSGVVYGLYTAEPPN
jgi:hypothetical protein